MTLMQDKIAELRERQEAMEAVLAIFPDAEATDDPAVFRSESVTLERCNRLYCLDDGDVRLCYETHHVMVMNFDEEFTLETDWLHLAMASGRAPEELHERVLQYAKKVVADRIAETK